MVEGASASVVTVPQPDTTMYDMQAVEQAANVIMQLQNGACFYITSDQATPAPGHEILQDHRAQPLVPAMAVEARHHGAGQPPGARALLHAVSRELAASHVGAGPRADAGWGSSPALAEWQACVLECMRHPQMDFATTQATLQRAVQHAGSHLLTRGTALPQALGEIAASARTTQEARAMLRSFLGSWAAPRFRACWACGKHRLVRCTGAAPPDEDEAKEFVCGNGDALLVSRSCQQVRGSCGHACMRACTCAPSAWAMHAARRKVQA